MELRILLRRPRIVTPLPALWAMTEFRSTQSLPDRITPDDVSHCVCRSPVWSVEVAHPVGAESVENDVVGGRDATRQKLFAAACPAAAFAVPRLGVRGDAARKEPDILHSDIRAVVQVKAPIAPLDFDLVIVKSDRADVQKQFFGLGIVPIHEGREGGRGGRDNGRFGDRLEQMVFAVTAKTGSCRESHRLSFRPRLFRT